MILWYVITYVVYSKGLMNGSEQCHAMSWSLEYWDSVNVMFYFNSLWPSDAIWRQRSGSPLAQVMACCLTAPSHYLNQCWLIITKGPVMFIWRQFRLRYHSHQSLKLAGNYFSQILLKSPRGQWVNMWNWKNNRYGMCCIDHWCIVKDVTLLSATEL